MYVRGFYLSVALHEGVAILTIDINHANYICRYMYKLCKYYIFTISVFLIMIA